MPHLAADLTDGIRWFADLIPIVAVLLGVLILFELAILLGALIATLEERSPGRGAEDATAPRPGAAGPVSRPVRSAVPEVRERSVRAR